MNSVAPRACAPTASGTARSEPGLRMMLVLSALMSFASVSTDIYLPALPTIARQLHAPRGSIELTLSAFLVGFVVGQLVWGPVSDRRGRRRPIAIGLCLFIAGCLGCGLATSISQMFAWRAVQAVGASVGPVLSRAMVRDLYSRERSAHMLSTLILIMGVAPLAGPLIGGQVLAYGSWRDIFWLLTALGLFTLVALRLLPETLPPSRRSREPLRRVFAEYLELVRDPRLVGYAFAGGAFYGGAYAFIIATPFVYIDFFGVSPQAYGWLFAVNIVGMMAANFVNARLLPRFGSERLFRSGTWVVAAAGVALAVDASRGWGGLLGIAAPIFFFMSMNGFIVANSVAGALAAFPRRAGAASSVVGAMHYGSGILTAAAVGWLADGTPRPMAWIMGIAGVGCAGASALAARLRSQPGR